MAQRAESKTVKPMRLDIGDNYYRGYRISLHDDPEPFNPRKESEHLGTMVTWHRRYFFGDLQVPIGTEMPTAQVCAPLYLLDHSGMRLSMAPFCDPWDSGQVGWIYVEDDKARKELGITDERKLTDEEVTHLFKVLHAETEEMDQYMSGEVYMLEIFTEDNEEVDTMGGVFGYDWACEFAQQLVDGDIEMKAGHQ